ncbi:major facilitator superfamily domain-containing protein [Aspergillus karnatakaensis]|uniref:major facilitator superfamily domain-containing protein n=1 Tax=Aspergillus karnatakaensis TaxID=1810916 RepID=UPI003CCDB8BF
MLAPQTFPAVRKGTKSCTECRRRKVRCVRIPEDAPTCRQCAERNTACLAQTSSSRPRQAQRLPSRYRIAQLESQVSRLTRIVNTIEVKLGGNASMQDATHTPDSDDSDGESTASEILIADEPSQLRSLFQNDWLSVDSHRRNEQLQERRVKASAHLLESLRPALQKLIPSKEETAEMLICTYDWLGMLHCMLPQPSIPSSNKEMLDQHDEMCQPDVDVVVLSSWLLAVAITAQQFPHADEHQEAWLENAQRRMEFARVVSDTVENLVMTHDRLVGTLQGLGMCLHFVRLQMSRGNPQKGWLKLRHAVALAELMGLPKAAQLARFKKANGVPDEAVWSEKVQLWDLMCTIDRMAGMLINLPPYTRRYPARTSPALIVDGIVQPSVYVSRLVDITPKIHDLEELSATEGTSTKLYTSALEIAREARDLASQTPKSWWIINPGDELKPDHIVQFVHYCIVMKAHLPVAIRQDRSEEYLYSRLACMDACESVAGRYQFLRTNLPTGFFTLRLLDLQAFAAMVLLLLTSHTPPSPDQRSFKIDKTRLERVVTQVIELMEQKSKEGAGSDFAERGATTLRALRNLLQQEHNDSARVQELTVNVPLLGKIHIRRNLPTTQPAQPQSQVPPKAAPQLSGWQTSEPTVIPGFNRQPAMANFRQDALLAGQTRPEMQWDYLSWSIDETSDNLFQDALMTDTLDQAALWQNPYYNLPFKEPKTAGAESFAEAQEQPSAAPIPNGGFEAWISVVAVFCVFVNTWGIISTYGAFQEFYLTELLPDESSSAISWVGSLQATLIVMVGIVSGPLVDLGYLRLLIMSGSFLVVFGMMMTSLATQYYQVILAQGFCVGIGGGIAYIPSLVVISMFFTTKRPIAIGCASIGSSVGSVVFPIMFRQLQPKIGFPWTVRSIAFINLLLAIITCAVLCRKPGQKIGARSLIDWKAFTDIPFMLFSVSLTCVMLAYWIPLFYVASYSRTVLQTTTSLSFYMLAIINGASAFGRTVPYLLGSRVKPICTLTFCVGASALAMFTWIAATTTPGFIVWACYWGILTGVLVTAPTSIISHPALCPDMKMLGTRMGMMWGISSFGSLAGTPIAGTLVNLSDAQFLRAQLFAGCLMVGAVILQLWPMLVVLRYDRQRSHS